MNELISTTQSAPRRKTERRWCGRLTAALLAIGAVFAYTGCVATGVGYDAGYYAPSYSAYYGDYGYNGYPYWGGGPYVGSTIVISGRSHRGYYGGHHYLRDSRRSSGRGFGRRGFSRRGVGPRTHLRAAPR